MSRGHVKETRAATDELAEVVAVGKASNNRGLWEGFSGVGDAEVRAKH